MPLSPDIQANGIMFLPHLIETWMSGRTFKEPDTSRKESEAINLQKFLDISQDLLSFFLRPL